MSVKWDGPAALAPPEKRSSTPDNRLAIILPLLAVGVLMLRQPLFSSREKKVRRTVK
jgi:hypothetical protein